LQIVCNASEAHGRNVKQIETLVNTCAEQGKTIESLLQGDSSFSSDASRVTAKRQRISEPSTTAAPPSTTNTATNDQNGDAWDLFSNMMREDTRSMYY
jgi:hypothetical protein